MRTDANDDSSFRNREVRCTTVSWKEGKKNALNGVYDWVVDLVNLISQQISL